MKSKFLLSAGIFFVLFILFLPLDFFGNTQFTITNFFFKDITTAVLQLLEIRNSRIDFSSDSASMIVLMIMLLIFSGILSISLPQRIGEAILSYCREFVILYLAVILLKYGFDKIGKAQFYLPEPNILYTRFGNLDRDILYWSTMGTSRFYSVFIGLAEVFSGILMLFRRTKSIGLLLATGILINVLGINFGFDISVKMFSSVLLMMTVFALHDQWYLLYRFFILKKETRLSPQITDTVIKNPGWVFFKNLFLGISFTMIVLPFLNTGNFNDDLAARPLLHGVFKNTDGKYSVKYIFFHRDSYFIMMDENENFKDYHYSINDSEKSMVLEDYQGGKNEVKFNYSKQDSILKLIFEDQILEARQLNWKKMNALKPDFHLFIEEVK